MYLDYKSGGSRVLTIIRKVEGDVEVRLLSVCNCHQHLTHLLPPSQALEKMLRAQLNVKGLLSRADGLTGSVTVSGNYKDRTVAWLRSIGF